MLALGRCGVTLVNSMVAMGQCVPEDVFRKEMADVFGRGVCGSAARLRDPLPID
jgi:hypothetical protein